MSYKPNPTDASYIQEPSAAATGPGWSETAVWSSLSNVMRNATTQFPEKTENQEAAKLKS